MTYKGRMATPQRNAAVRLWPIGVVLVMLIAAYALGLQRFLSFDALGRQREHLRALVAAYPIATAAGYELLYIAAVTVSLPGAVVLTMAGGLLFGTVLGAACAVVGATCGAVLLFLAARYATGDWLTARAGPFMARLQAGLRQDGFNYLLALRLIPVVPFWLLNLAPAIAGMRLLAFAAATFLGIIPGTVVFASIGAGIGTLLAEGRHPDLSILFRPTLILPLIGLALLSLLPVAWRRWRGRPMGPTL